MIHDHPWRYSFRAFLWVVVLGCIIGYLYTYGSALYAWLGCVPLTYLILTHRRYVAEWFGDNLVVTRKQFVYLDNDDRQISLPRSAITLVQVREERHSTSLLGILLDHLSKKKDRATGIHVLTFEWNGEPRTLSVHIPGTAE